MKVETTSWDPTTGWRALPALDSPSTLVVMLGDVDAVTAADAASGLRAAFPDAAVVGCSTAGQIVGPTVTDGGCVAAVARFDRVPLRCATATISDPADSSATGRSIGADLLTPDLRAVVVLSAGIGVNGSALVAGLAAEVGPSVSVTGGLAGDGDRLSPPGSSTASASAPISSSRSVCTAPTSRWRRDRAAAGASSGPSGS